MMNNESSGGSYTEDLDSDLLLIEDQEDVIDDEKFDEEVVVAPINIHIGFLSNAKKSHVKKHIQAFINNHFSTAEDVTYQIVRYEDGYIFEIHQGGGGLGYLSDFMENQYENPVIITEDNIFRFTHSTMGGVKLIKLSDADVQKVLSSPQSHDVLQGKDKLTPFVASWVGFYRSTLAILVLSMVALFAAVIIRFTVLDKDEAIYFTNINKTFAHDFIPEINQEMLKMNPSTDYFTSFVFNSRLPKEQRLRFERGSILNVPNDPEKGEE